MRLILLITVILAITYVQLKADLINQIKLHEGYDNKPYKDGYSYSVGYGTQLPITKAEATLLLIHRLSIIDNTFKHTYPWYHGLPTPIKNIVLNMGYNLGTRGFSKFK
ncbi:MAG: hypothetical protein U9N34_01505, partial [Candidatus Cloacimonadota bacterium]|nr:hypothetical protein [Candidatus Cloacimonadota bacterium]